ncbi:uncharacterized protein LOC110849731 [Folsomia candida]|uniref:uncharacterized protein LOC110849731 n=1 Tax=Folsomia candida TaxID=158441 RepID=UPI000B8F6086|nr:uncharacterized protein LOC110849731 [Folsomia candida]
MKMYKSFNLLVVLLTVYLVGHLDGARVTFCSGIDQTGSCATKNVEIGRFTTKCEDFPFRFRWFLTARSVKIENSLMNGCNSTCRLHTSDSCRCWLGNCPTIDLVGCQVQNLDPGHDFEGVSCV